MNSIVIFTGPTIPRDEAGSLTDAIFLPPVAQGDVYTACKAYRPAIIGIIDGYFANVPSVWHKEILYAMAQGVHVFGASSMGALRAAELHQFGMQGIGEIFEAYRDGVIEDDDEVAVIHGPAELGYPALSEALVNIRKTLADAHAAGILGRVQYEDALAHAKALHYKSRSWPVIEAGMRERGMTPATIESFTRWLETGRRDLKREDAVALLEKMTELGDAPLPPLAVTYKFEATSMWLNAVNRLGKGIQDANSLPDMAAQPDRPRIREY